MPWAEVSSLEGNMITGTIPDLSELVDLQLLLLADNLLYGSIPSEVGEMSNLVTIDISNNQLTGSIPSLLNSDNLVALILDNNFLVGFDEPVDINAQLEELSIYGNHFEGTIPLALTDLPNLRSLNMSLNRLSGKIPSGLTNFASVLDLSQNQLSGSIPIDLLQPRELGSPLSVNLSFNYLSGSIPTPNTTSLEIFSIDISANQLSGSIPWAYLFCSVLNLENNFLSGDIVDVLVGGQQFPIVSRLFLGNNSLTGDLSRLTFEWRNWVSLTTFDLSNNNLSWSTSESIPDPIGAALSNMPIELTEFSVGGNNFSGTSLPGAMNGTLSQLVILDFSYSQLKGKILGDVFNGMRMPYLQILNLSHNSALSPIPESINTIPLLRVFDVSFNMLAGSLPLLRSALNDPRFFVGNNLCGYLGSPCIQPYSLKDLQWVVLLVIGAAMMAAAGSVGGACWIVTWRWRLYIKLHQQDADLIRILMDRELVTLMPLSDLKKATNNFANNTQIGEGGFGAVYVGKLSNGTKVAIKRSKRGGCEKDKEQFLNEVRILSKVHHRHLVKLMGCCMANKVALLVFEFISNGTLQEHLQRKIGDGHYLSWKQRLNIAVQTADALNYLHSATAFPIYHRDVKSANILLNDDLSVKVADFGISKLVPARVTHVSTALQGTIGYMDPEYWVSFQLTAKSDVYSFGVVLLELISAKAAIDYERAEEETSLVTFASPYIQSGNLEPLIDPALMEIYGEQDGHGKMSILDVARLAMRCLAMHSNARPSMTEVWKDLQDMCLKYDGVFMLDQDLGGLNNEDKENLSLHDDQQIFPSVLVLDNSFHSHKQGENGGIELGHFGR